MGLKKEESRTRSTLTVSDNQDDPVFTKLLNQFLKIHTRRDGVQSLRRDLDKWRRGHAIGQNSPHVRAIANDPEGTPSGNIASLALRIQVTPNKYHHYRGIAKSISKAQ